ncbi:MAG: M56 family metallopeptidase [Lachnospiraceae bacterium]|nr:M56 family metallopeptidase [Lachnospiraceae bacterium]
MVELMANLFFNSLILSIFIIFILMLTPLFKGYSRRWRYIAFFVIGVKLLLPFSFMPDKYGIQIPIIKSESIFTSDEKLQNSSDLAVANLTENTKNNNTENSNFNNNSNVIENDNAQISDVSKSSTQSSTNIKTENTLDTSDSTEAHSNSQVTSNKNGVASTVITTLKSISLITMLQYIFIVWASVSAVLLLGYLLIYQFHKKNIQRWSVSVEDPKLLKLFEDEKRTVGITNNIGFLQCKKINTPMAVGIIHPNILIPEMDDYSGLRYILRHELFHQKRHDMYTKVFYVIVKSVQWFNPFVRLMVKNAYDDIELLCDDEVVRSLEKVERIEYNESILNIVKKQCEYNDAENIVFSFGLIQGKDDLRERMINIMNMKNKKKGYIIASLLATTVLISASMVACGTPDNKTSKNSEIQTTTSSEVDTTKSDGEMLESLITEDTLPQILVAALEREKFDTSTGLYDEKKLNAYSLVEAVQRISWSNPSYIKLGDESLIISEDDLAQIAEVLTPTPMSEYIKNDPDEISKQDGNYYIYAADPGDIQYLINSKTINDNEEMVIKGTSAPNNTGDFNGITLYNYEMVLKYINNNKYGYQVVSAKISMTDEYKDYLKNDLLKMVTDENNAATQFLTAALSVEIAKDDEPSAKSSPFWSKVWYTSVRLLENDLIKYTREGDYWVVAEDVVEQIGKVFADKPLSENPIPDGFTLVKYNNGKYYLGMGDPGMAYYVVTDSKLNDDGSISVKGYSPDYQDKNLTVCTFTAKIEGSVNDYGYRIIEADPTYTEEYLEYIKKLNND